MAGALARRPTPGPLRRHWLAVALLAVGFLLRLLATVSYRPALFYIDTVRYLYDSGGNDPVGYRLPLKALLAIGNFDLVAVVQHLLGLGMAVTIYVVLVRRAVPRWLAALAMLPLLLDAYQIQMEQMLLPDIWFEALIVAGAAVLLAGQGPGVRTRAVAVAGLVLGVSATFRQVGEILIVPALLYVVVACRGWLTTLSRCAVLVAGFAVPILLYMTGSYLLVGHFYLSHSGVTTTYGRMAWSADCATLRLPAVERGLCPTPAQRAKGPDWLEHNPKSPIRVYYTGPLSDRASQLVASFNHAVLTQQPGRILGTYAQDAVKLFAPGKVTSAGDTPVGRWQFQPRYPYLSPHATPAQVTPAVRAYGGGQPEVWRPGASILRAYQLGGGYTPGPVFAFCVLAGLAGSVLAGAGRLRRPALDAGEACGGEDEPAEGRPAVARPRCSGSPGAGDHDHGALTALYAELFHFAERIQSYVRKSTPEVKSLRTNPGKPSTNPIPEASDNDATTNNPPEAAHEFPATDQTTPAWTPADQTTPAKARADHTTPAGTRADHTTPAGTQADHTTPAKARADQTSPAGARAEDARARCEAGWRRLAVGSLLFFGCGAAVLLLSDLFEFTWRYQLPALVTLPPGAVLALAALVGWRARQADPPRRTPAASGGRRTDPSQELARPSHSAP